MKKKVIIFAAVCYILLAGSQTAKAQVKGQVTINVGIGAGAMFNTTYGQYWSFANGNLFTDDLLPSKGSNSPAFNFVAEYGITKKSASGIAVSYQMLTDKPNIRISPYPNAIETVYRLNIAARYIHYLGSIEIFYYGFRLGVSLWRDILPKGMDPEFAAVVPTSFVRPSLQLLFGMKYYFTYNLGVHTELALGSPYLAEGGAYF